MKYKITYHCMPWEVDYALLSFQQLKKSSYYLDFTEDQIIIDFELNLSSKLFDWKNSNLPKQFFKDKIKAALPLLDKYQVIQRYYEGPKLRGHLDHQREAIETDVDFYLNICPDIYFSEHLLSLLIAVSKQVKNEYFVLTPEIYKMWDATWDEITNAEYLNIPYENWNKGDVYDLRASMKNQESYLRGEVTVTPEITNRSKWAGWFDLYNKAFYEVLAPYREEWKGYGPWDWYSMIISEHAKASGLDFQQYVLRGQTIFEYCTGDLLEGGFSGFYKPYIKMKPNVPDQRKEFEANMKDYLDKTIKGWEKTILI